MGRAAALAILFSAIATSACSGTPSDYDSCPPVVGKFSSERSEIRIVNTANLLEGKSSVALRWCVDEICKEGVVSTEADKDIQVGVDTVRMNNGWIAITFRSLSGSSGNPRASTVIVTIEGREFSRVVAVKRVVREYCGNVNEDYVFYTTFNAALPPD